MIIDAGGGTIDVSSYYMTTSPPTIQEIAPAECKPELLSWIVRTDKLVCRPLARCNIRHQTRSKVPRR